LSRLIMVLAPAGSVWASRYWLARLGQRPLVSHWTHESGLYTRVARAYRGTSPPRTKRTYSGYR